MRIIFIFCTIVIGLNLVHGISQSESLLQIDQPQNENPIQISPEQERINTIIRSFRHLPDSELQLYGLSLETLYPHNYPSDSSKSMDLINMWNLRQLEIKQAMAGTVKPAEYMANITQKLQIVQLPTSAKLRLLEELESFVEDIDNARDFHTIGGWPVLLSYLLPGIFSLIPDASRTQVEYLIQPPELQAKAAWVIGTAIKDNYDFQLWLLDSHTFNYPSLSQEIAPYPVQVKGTGLQLLLYALQLQLPLLSSSSSSDMTSSSESLHFSNMLLYAISSASRGNVNIQEQLLQPSPLTASYPILSSTHGKIPFYIEMVSTSTSLSPLPSLLSELLQLPTPHLSPSTSTDMSRNPTSSLVPSTFASLSRRVWSLVSDMLEERAYTRSLLPSDLIPPSPHDDLDSSVLSLHPRPPSEGKEFSISKEEADLKPPSNEQRNDTDSTGQSSTLSSSEAASIASQLESLPLLGDAFLTPQWTLLAMRELQRIKLELSTLSVFSPAAAAVAPDLEFNSEFLQREKERETRETRSTGENTVNSLIQMISSTLPGPARSSSLLPFGSMLIRKSSLSTEKNPSPEEQSNDKSDLSTLSEVIRSELLSLQSSLLGSFSLEPKKKDSVEIVEAEAEGEVEVEVEDSVLEASGTLSRGPFSVLLSQIEKCLALL